MITFSIFTLSHFIWRDQFAWSGVVQQQERALNGAPHIESTLIQVGRPITLVSDMETFTLFAQLQSHAVSNQTPFAIDINGTSYNVIWLHNPIAVAGEPVSQFSDDNPDHFKNVVLTLITV